MRRTWWKIYFFVILTPTVLGVGSALVTEKGGGLPWWEWVLMPVSLVQILGLFGFAFWRRLAIPLLWQLFFLVSVANYIWSVVSIASDPELKDDAFFVGAVFFLQIPMLIGLFLYAFRCKELWGGAT